jgi:hypothetical protein
MGTEVKKMASKGILGLGIIDTEKGILSGIGNGQRPLTQRLGETIPLLKTGAVWGAGATVGSVATGKVIDRVMDLVTRLRI